MMTSRQRIEALYFRARQMLLRRCDLEAYLLVTLEDMSKRKTIVPAIAGLDLPIDWRAAQRAAQETIVIQMALLFVWTLILQWKFVAALHIADTWWLPFSFLGGLLRYPAAWASIPWPTVVVWMVGFPVLDAIVRTIRAYRSCDRTGLGVEFGSAYIGMPEHYASPDPKLNLFPPGYDIYGGFHPDERRRRLLDLEALTAQQEEAALRLFRAGAPKIPMASNALLDTDKSARPVAKSRVQEILEEAR